MTSPTSGWQDESVQQQQMLSLLAAYQTAHAQHENDSEPEVQPVVMRKHDKPHTDRRPEVIDTRVTSQQDAKQPHKVPKPQSYAAPSQPPPLSRDSDRTRSLDARPRAHSDNQAVQDMFARQHPVRPYESMREAHTEVPRKNLATLY